MWHGFASRIVLCLAIAGCGGNHPMGDKPNNQRSDFAGTNDLANSDPARDMASSAGDMASGANDLANSAVDLAEVTGPDLADTSAPTIYGCTPGAYGTVGAVWHGVKVYCEPSSGTGFYQCDELGNRWVRDALSHPNIENVATDNAYTVCQKAVMVGTTWYSVYGPGFTDSHGHAPVAGDLIVWNPSPPWTGHVAVVYAASPTIVDYLQQNDGPPNASIGWDPTTSFFTDSKAECFIHPEPHAPAPPPSGPDCGCFANGDTCGLAIVDRENWYGCTANVSGKVDYDTVYSCTNGVFTPKTVCDKGCVVNGLFPPTGACVP
jgi:hypothetical protein